MLFLILQQCAMDIGDLVIMFFYTIGEFTYTMEEPFLFTLKCPKYYWFIIVQPKQ